MTNNLRNTVRAVQVNGLWDVVVDGTRYPLLHLRPGSATREGNKIADRLMAERAALAAQVDEHVATREMGRKMGLTEAQIDSFIARQA
jgi:hypothetical protein